MSTYSTQLDPFIAQIKIDSDAGNFGPSYVSTNFRSNREYTKALFEMMVAELADAIFDEGPTVSQQDGIKAAVKSRMQRVWSETQKQTFGTGGLGGQAPTGLQHS